MKQNLREIFEDESGRLSSTRMIGFLLILAGIVSTFLGDQTGANASYTAGIGLLGAGQLKAAIRPKSSEG